MQLNPLVYSADITYTDGHKETLRHFLATDSIQRFLVGSGVDVSIDYLEALTEEYRIIIVFIQMLINIGMCVWLVQLAKRFGPGLFGKASEKRERDKEFR